MYYYIPAVFRTLLKRLSPLHRKAILAGVFLALLYATLHGRRRLLISSAPPEEGLPVAGFIVRSSRRNRSSEPGGGDGGIPRIIHQTWRGRDDIPETFRPWMESWIKRNGGWDYWFWTDEDMRQFMASAFPQFLNLYDSYPSQFYRVDAFRYFLLYAHGGLYADLDMECLRPLDKVIARDECILSQEPLEHAHFLSHLGPPLVSNALMACRRAHPFFKYVIENLNSYTGSLSWMDILHATGPFMLTEVFRNYHSAWPSGSDKAGFSHAVRLGSPEEFQPQPDDSMVEHMRRMCQSSGGRAMWSGETARLQQKLCKKLVGHDFGRRIDPSAYTNHHWTHTWAGKLHDPWAVHDMRIRFPVSDLLFVRRS